MLSAGTSSMSSSKRCSSMARLPSTSRNSMHETKRNGIFAEGCGIRLSSAYLHGHSCVIRDRSSVHAVFRQHDVRVMPSPLHESECMTAATPHHRRLDLAGV